MKSIIKRFSRGICLMLSIILIVSFAACNKSNTDDQKNNTQSESKTEGTEKIVIEEFKLPLTDEKVNLTFSTMDNHYGPASYASDLTIWKEIEQKTNVHIEWQVFPAEQYGQVIQTKFAAGVDLPDIVGHVDNVMTQAEQGIILPLNQLINQYAPNLVKFFSDYPDMKKVHTQYDGNIYWISSFSEPACDFRSFNIRRDWLEKYQLKMPETLDDWYAMLKCFRENDPNGNGQKDEIPLLGDPISTFQNAFGISGDYNDGFYADKNGKILYQYITENMKELLKWLNKLYAEDILLQDYDKPLGDASYADIFANKVGSIKYYPTGMITVNSVLAQVGVKDAAYIYVKPPKGPNGDQFILRDTPFITSYNTAITKNCKDSKVAIKWIDYVFASEEGKNYMTWGLENLTYVMKDGKKQFTDYVLKNPDNLGPTDVLRKEGAMPTFAWYNLKGKDEQILQSSPEYMSSIEDMAPYAHYSYLALSSTKEEQEKLVLMDDIRTYVSEKMSDFIRGKDSLENFDEFVSKVKEMGLDQVLEIKQSQYERFQNN